MITEVKIGNKTFKNANVNSYGDNLEVEVPYFKDWDNTSGLTINGVKYIMFQGTDVAGRGEVIKMIVQKSEVKNERKQVQSGKDTKS
tara:strand:- start:774 stop:1034 length:261 start_codon:yes stop_codon:yes gene_type:complete